MMGKKERGKKTKEEQYRLSNVLRDVGDDGEKAEITWKKRKKEKTRHADK
jgi:hypothetical protein